MVEGDDVIFQLSKNLVSKNNSMQLTREYSILHHPKKAAQGPVSSGPRLHCIQCQRCIWDSLGPPVLTCFMWIKVSYETVQDKSWVIDS